MESLFPSCFSCKFWLESTTASYYQIPASFLINNLKQSHGPKQNQLRKSKLEKYFYYCPKRKKKSTFTVIPSNQKQT